MISATRPGVLISAKRAGLAAGATRPAARAVTALAAALLGLAGLLAGCGQVPVNGGSSGSASLTAAPSTGAPSGAPSGGGTGSATAAPSGSLDITISGLPGGAAEHWTLTCDPAGGTHPAAAATCAGLAQPADPFAPPAHGTMCPAIVVGPAKATITGVWRGRPVHLTLTESGCDLITWNRLSQLLGGKAPA